MMSKRRVIQTTLSSPKGQDRLRSTCERTDVPVTSTNCSSSGDQAAAFMPESTLPTISTCGELKLGCLSFISHSQDLAGPV